MYIPAPLCPCCLPLRCSKCYHSLVQLHMDNRGLHDTARLEKAWKVIKEALKAVRGAPPVSLCEKGSCVCACGVAIYVAMFCAVLYDVKQQRRFLAEPAALAEVQCRTFQHKRSLLTTQYKMYVCILLRGAFVVYPCTVCLYIVLSPYQIMGCYGM